MPKISNPHKTSHQNGGEDEISVAGLSGALADPQTPSAHASSHKDGEADEIDLSGLSGQQIVVPYNGKIADIKEADTNKHTLDLATALGETRKIIGLILNGARISGTGVLYAYPNEGARGGGIYLGEVESHLVVIAEGTQRLQYKQTVANDDFDVYCLGYTVEA